MFCLLYFNRLYLFLLLSKNILSDFHPFEIDFNLKKIKGMNISKKYRNLIFKKFISKIHKKIRSKNRRKNNYLLFGNWNFGVIQTPVILMPSQYKIEE